MSTIRRPILVVDDDFVVRHMICRALEEEGFATTAAANGRAAVEQAQQHQPVLVVLDVSTRQINGESVAEQLRRLLGPALPILATSTGESITAQAQAIGAYAFLGKPFDVQELVNCIRRGLP